MVGRHEPHDGACAVEPHDAACAVLHVIVECLNVPLLLLPPDYFCFPKSYVRLQRAECQESNALWPQLRNAFTCLGFSPAPGGDIPPLVMNPPTNPQDEGNKGAASGEKGRGGT